MMKNKLSLFILLIVVVGLSSFGISKKKKFLDYFTNYKADTLTVGYIDYSVMYDDPNAPVSIKGTYIDSIHHKIFELEAAEDIRDFSTYAPDLGLMAYHKIKLDLGYYLLVIRSGGEYWNSRFYGCLYNSGDKHVMSTFVLADAIGDAGYFFIRESSLKREDNQWSIQTHEFYSEPLDYLQEDPDSMQIREVDVVTTIEQREEHFFFVEKSNTEKSYIKLY